MHTHTKEKKGTIDLQWLMPVVSELEMLRQEDGCELKLVWATGDPLCLEKKKK